MTAIHAVGAQNIDPNTLRSTLARPQETQAKKAEQAGKQFEAIFIRQFLGDALKPSMAGAVEEDSAGGDTYRYFITDILSQNLAERGVFGLGEALARQMLARETHQTDAENTAKDITKDGMVPAKEPLTGTARQKAPPTSNPTLLKSR